MPVAAHELPKEKRSLFSQSTPSWSDSNGAEAATVELHATSNVFRVMLVNGKMNDAPAAGRENEASAIRSIVSQDRCHSGRVAGPEPSERQAKGCRPGRVSEGCLWPFFAITCPDHRKGDFSFLPEDSGRFARDPVRVKSIHRHGGPAAPRPG